MKYFVMSDIHIDFYINNQSKTYSDVLSDFEKFYSNYMLTAEGIICAGDIANDYYNQVNFYNFLLTKYQEIYIVFGNHDLVVTGSTFGNGNPFKYSEDKCSAIRQQFMNNPHIHILNDPTVINGFGGTMGMCDFHYEHMYDLGTAYKIKQWQKHWFDSRTWHIKTPEWHSEYLINPVAIWISEKDKMIKIAEQQPKVMITHFCPMQLGVQKEYENSDSTAFFYFDGKEILDIFDHETYWFCGHIHACAHCDYINAKGQIIHIWALPNAYPTENPYTEGAFETVHESDDSYHGVHKNYDKESRIFEL